MRIAFRADASIDIGTGHVMRCVTLAEALRSRGHECLFIGRDHPGNLEALIRQKGFEVHLLAPGRSDALIPEQESVPAHSDWLGVPWHFDADQTRNIVGGRQVDWVVVDHYALDARWEQEVSQVGAKVMVIDDLADRNHHCRLLLDQNLGRQPEDYDGLTKPDCIRLCGPRYALLRPEFAAMRKLSLERRRSPEVRRILITLGGVDRENVTGEVLRVLSRSRLPPETELDIVMGASAPGLDSVRVQASKLPFRATVSVNVSDMAERMCLADLCIGAAGGTSWERCCLGLPTVLLVLAENQEGGAKALGDVGAAIVVRREGESIDALESVVDRLLGSHELSEIGQMASSVTEGNGVESVLEKMMLCSEEH